MLVNTQKYSFFYKNKFIFDCLLALTILIISFWISYSELLNYRAKPIKHQYYTQQLYFEPAVLIACNKGFGTFMPPVIGFEPLEQYFIQKPNVNDSPLKKFLQTDRDAIDCKELPDNAYINKNPPQKIWFYLLSAVGLLWKITGISWHSLDIFSAILFSISMSLCFFIFRLGMNRIVSLFLSLLLIGSTLQLTFLPWTRDYSKTPFFLGIFLIIGLLVKKPYTFLNLSILTCLLGLMIGIGFGVRSDLAITLPVAVLTLLFFIPKNNNVNIFKKLFVLILLLMSFYMAAMPVINARIRSGDVGFDHILLGLSKPFSQVLKINSSSIYHIAHLYNDLLIYTMVGTHADHYLKMDLDQSLDKSREINAYPYSYGTVDYNKASTSLFKHIAWLIPSDLFIRSYLSLQHMLTLGFTTWHELSLLPWQTIVLMPTDNCCTLFYKWTRSFLNVFQELNLFISIFVIFLVGIFNLRMAIFLFLFLVYFFSYPAIQYNPRNYFHLEIISLWGLGFLLSKAFSFKESRLYLRKFLSQNSLSKQCFKSVSVISTLFAMFGLFFISARYLQTKNIEQLAMQYQASKKTILTKNIQKLQNENVLIKLDPFKGKSKKKYATGKMILIELGGMNCQADEIDFALEYDMDPNLVPSFNLTKEDKVVIKSNRVTSIYTPVYQSEHYQFKGLRLNGNKIGCFINSYQLSNLEDLPLWIYLKLPANWQNARMYDMKE